MEQVVVSDPKVLCLPPSQMVAQELERYYGRREGVRVVYNAVDVPDPAGAPRAEWRQRLRGGMGLDDDAVVFLVVAMNFALKGVAESIIAFARWYHTRRGRRLARLVIVGREAPEGYQRHANLRDVAGAVVFVPYAREVFQWYAAGDVCMLLSWYDPCSRVVLEAARWGIPSVTTIFNGAAELLAEGAGIAVRSPQDCKAIVGAMEQMADPDRRAAFSAACNRLADRLGIRRHVDELLQAYAELPGRA
jgi:UDP-glucose:(heptosyl)LPS alpha-1,3-glucosyltransferase